VIVGSGADGGPLAGNLAKAGQKVLLLEAGSDYEDYNYQVPAFHALASEDENPRWDYFVRHYASDEQQRRDTNSPRSAMAFCRGRWNKPTNSSLPPRQRAVLLLFAQRDSWLIVELARELTCSVPTASRTVDRLQRQGALWCATATEDHRRVQVRLTAYGQELLNTLPQQESAHPLQHPLTLD
jgi:DNA-binding MarR family transcriptional regulator